MLDALEAASRERAKRAGKGTLVVEDMAVSVEGTRRIDARSSAHSRSDGHGTHSLSPLPRSTRRVARHGEQQATSLTTRTALEAAPN
jgi:hypothetical protein